MERRLDINVGRSIADFQAVAKAFELKTKLYRIIFRGKGLEFDGFRTYGPDDNADDIDWKASARANKLLVKQYREERKLKFVFVIDVGDNMVSGSTEKLKCEYAGEVVAALSHLIFDIGDQVGIVFSSSRGHEYIPPIGRRGQYGLLMEVLSDATKYGGGSALHGALDFVSGTCGGNVHAVIFVSDFLNVDRSLERLFRLVSSRHETMAFMVKDPLDMNLPDVSAEVIISDPLTNERMIINPKVARKQYAQLAKEQEKMVESVLSRADIDLLKFTTDHPFAVPLAQFLRERVEHRVTI